MNHSFKSKFSEKYENYISLLSGPGDMTKKGYWKPPSRELRVQWISNVWNPIIKETITNGFKIYQGIENDISFDTEEQKEDEIDIKDLELLENLNLSDSDEEIIPDEDDEIEMEDDERNWLKYIIL